MSARHHRSARLLCAALVAPAALLGSALSAQAATQFRPADGSTCQINTSALTWVCDDGSSAAGTVVDGAAEFDFDSVYLDIHVSARVSGTRAFRLVVAHDLQLWGAIDASGHDGDDADGAPGPGGAAGGAAGQAGAGVGGGGAASSAASGAGGGGFRGSGARGADVGGTGGTGGAAYGGHGALLAGSGGGGGTGVAGGGGGGAVELVGDYISINRTGRVLANGGDGVAGTQPGDGASGGGSGGLILIKARDVAEGGGLIAQGGFGGSGADETSGNGGGGGGGEIAICFAGEQYQTDDEGGTLIDVSGGPSHAFLVDTGVASSDPKGGDGTVQLVTDAPFRVTSSPVVKYGSRALLTTRLVYFHNYDGLIDRTVSLYRRNASGAGWTRVGTTTTGDGSANSRPSGEASLYIAPVQNTTYQWRWAGEDFAPPATRTTQVHVQHLVYAAATRHRASPGQTVTIYGSVRPYSAGQHVWLKRYVGGKWVNLTYATLHRQKLPNGNTIVGYQFHRTFSRGTVKLQVVKPATSTLDKGTSQTLTITVG